MPILHLMWPNAEHSHILAVKAARYGLVPRLRPIDPEADKYLVS